MKKSPLTQVKERFGEDRSEAKSKLVAAVRALSDSGLWIDRVNGDKGLECVSNRKLLHLHDVLTQVQSAFGNREGLIDAILKAEKREKDEGFKSRLEGQSTPRLWDYHRS